MVWRIWGSRLQGKGEHLRERVREVVDVREGESDVRVRVSW